MMPPLFKFSGSATALVCALLRINDCSMLLNELFSYFLTQNQTKSAFSLRLVGQFFSFMSSFSIYNISNHYTLSFSRLYTPLCAMLLFETLVWDYSQWVNLDFNHSIVVCNNRSQLTM
jgi:hypothetical protein